MLHQMLCSEFDAAFSQMKPIAGVFLNMGPQFKTYSNYTESYAAVEALCAELQKSSYIPEKWLRGQLDLARNSLLQGDLQSFIMAPIQRIMRYPLLLEALQKRCSPVLDADATLVNRALAQMQQMAVRADARKADAVAQTRWTQLLSQFPEKERLRLDAPHRRFIRDQRLTLRLTVKAAESAQAAPGAPIDAVMVLCQDILILAQARRSQLPLLPDGVIEFSNETQVVASGLPDSADFVLAVTGRPVPFAVVTCPSPEVRDEWVNLISATSTEQQARERLFQGKLVWESPQAVRNPDVAGPRAWHSATVLENRMWVYGGRNQAEVMNTLAVMDATTQSWAKVQPPHGHEAPPALMMHASALAGTTWYFFGGTDDLAGQGCLGDLWAMQLPSGRIARVTPSPQSPRPPARVQASLVYYPTRHQLVLYGGRGDEGLLGDAWAYDIASATWMDMSPDGPHQPLPRCMHTATLLGRHMVVMGGFLGPAAPGMQCFSASLDACHFWMLDLEQGDWVSTVSGLTPNQPAVPASPTSAFGRLRATAQRLPMTDPALVALKLSPGVHQLFGHSASNVCGHLFLFGGGEGPEKKPAASASPTVATGPAVTNTLRILDSSNFQYHDAGTVILKAPVPTQGHTAVLVGSRLFVYGGVDYLNLCVSTCTPLDCIALVAPMLGRLSSDVRPSLRTLAPSTVSSIALGNAPPAAAMVAPRAGGASEAAAGSGAAKGEELPYILQLAEYRLLALQQGPGDEELEEGDEEAAPVSGPRDGSVPPASAASGAAAASAGGATGAPGNRASGGSHRSSGGLAETEQDLIDHQRRMRQWRRMLTARLTGFRHQVAPAPPEPVLHEPAPGLPARAPTSVGGGPRLAPGPDPGPAPLSHRHRQHGHPAQAAPAAPAPSAHEAPPPRHPTPPPPPPTRVVPTPSPPPRSTQDGPASPALEPRRSQSAAPPPPPRLSGRAWPSSPMSRPARQPRGRPEHCPPAALRHPAPSGPSSGPSSSISTAAAKTLTRPLPALPPRPTPRAQQQLQPPAEGTPPPVVTQEAPAVMHHHTHPATLPLSLSTLPRPGLPAEGPPDPPMGGPGHHLSAAATMTLPRHRHEGPPLPRSFQTQLLAQLTRPASPGGAPQPPPRGVPLALPGTPPSPMSTLSTATTATTATSSTEGSSYTTCSSSDTASSESPPVPPRARFAAPPPPARDPATAFGVTLRRSQAAELRARFEQQQQQQQQLQPGAPQAPRPGPPSSPPTQRQRRRRGCREVRPLPPYPLPPAIPAISIPAIPSQVWVGLICSAIV
ncbi:hypothetical protein PAPYR_5270 [Paratrimastix pyriformis]|uniref:DH domain-containing protein n=1 Tax=Paratrimastix pyriformis TaxID=342808 RepID=A0ABQ8UN58_9EUKA|nr:hypothetical protein PAPYR_5270 [Paratrimastix pyriformis]